MLDTDLFLALCSSFINGDFSVCDLFGILTVHIYSAGLRLKHQFLH